MSRQLNITLILLFLTFIVKGQSIRFIGVDSTMNNYKNCKQTTLLLEQFHSEEIDKNITATILNTETSKYIENRFAVGGNLFFFLPRGQRVVNFQTYEVNGFGGGFAGFLRWEFVNLYQHNLFVETGTGMVFTTKAFPPLGTNYNFIHRFGFGANVKLTNTTQLTFGYRWIHISNGQGIIPENPSFNGNGLNIGFKFKNFKSKK